MESGRALLLEMMSILHPDPLWREKTDLMRLIRRVLLGRVLGWEPLPC